MMFGSPWIILGGAAGYVLAAALGWAALHEYGVARSQASRDQASVAQATANAADVARVMQQGADQQQIRHLQALADRAQRAYVLQQQITGGAARQLSAANIKLAALTAQAPAAACIRQPVPPQAAQAALWTHR